MKGLAALLLVGLATTVSAAVTLRPLAKTEATTKISNKWDFSTINLPDYAKPLTNPKDALMQEIHTLNDELANEKKVEEEVSNKLKIDAQKPTKPTDRTTIEYTSTTNLSTLNDTIEDDRQLKKLLEDEDRAYDNALDNEDEDEEDDDDYDDEDEDADEEDDDVDIDDDESIADDLDDDEDIMTKCPIYCKCSGQYASATSATCTKFLEQQSFGTGIAHLRIENANHIRLGPHALRSRGLQQLESITITDTAIDELDRTAFDDISYLFAVNLTRNGLEGIHPQIFQNNTQLSLLTISGNPLFNFQSQRHNLTKHYLLDAPNVAEFVFSNNGITHLPRAAFVKMQSLAYINLSNNQLRKIEKSLFDPLESLAELDLSNNLLNELPADIFDGRNLESLRINGNNFTTLAGISGNKLNLLEANHNKIKIIAKTDLLGMPFLEELRLKSNEIRKIHQHAFTNLTRLTNLDISNNKLTTINEHHFRTNSRLQVINLSHNPELRTLPIFRTTGIEYERFNVYRFECANCGLDYLEEETFHSMNALTHLNLARNRLRGLPNGLLSELSSLREMDLSYNNIETLGERMFKGATSLSKLSLAGNPLVTLQVKPFLMTPALNRLDVSECTLERIWSEARVPLKSLRFLSVRDNNLKRITVEELNAMPKLAGLDISQNPLDCDADFNLAIQWLTENNVTPKETFRYISNYEKAEDYVEAKGINHWIDLARIVCADVPDGPPPRTLTHRPKATIDETFDSATEEEPTKKIDLYDAIIDHGLQSNEEVDSAWAAQDQEYGIFDPTKSIDEYKSNYSRSFLPVITVILITLASLLLVANLAIYIAKRRGRSPVIRPPMLLRQGLIDNKNCGLVYKPLHEEIPTPHMPKRGSFYSSSTFHYDKIVPESV